MDEIQYSKWILGLANQIRPTLAGIERQRAVNYDIQCMENKLTIGISKKQLRIFYDVIQKMMENTS